MKHRFDGKEVAVMKLVRKSILPIAALLMIAVLGKYIYMVDGQIDLFRLCMVFGVPFGIPHMIFVVPIGRGISKGIGILALNVIMGALIGCVIAAISAVKAVGYLAYVVGTAIMRRTGNRVPY